MLLPSEAVSYLVLLSSRFLLYECHFSAVTVFVMVTKLKNLLEHTLNAIVFDGTLVIARVEIINL